MLLAATLRERLGESERRGDRVPFERPLQIFAPAPLPNFAPTTRNTTLQNVPAGWWATLGAPLLFSGEMAQALGPRGLVPFAATALLLALAWLGASYLGEWRRPCVPLLVLLALQGFGAAYYFSSFRAPPRRLQTPFTAFDFHTHTTRSSGLLTPQQQINWHRARGFKGLAFTDKNAMMPEDELSALRAANPDLLLLNGCEYQSGRAHLIMLGLKTVPRDRNVARAVRAAKAQGAVVIVAHPWEPGRISPGQFLQMGVDGFEAWNGQVWSRDLALLSKRRRLLATSATDDLSKSGARCFTWTLLPRGLDDAGDVLRALRLRKTAVAYALDERDTFAAYQNRRAAMRGLGAVPLALGAAWRTLALAQRINAVLGLVACVALLWMWGAQSSRRAAALPGPQRAVGFLRRRRLISRGVAAGLMLFAFIGSIGAAVLCMGWSSKSAAPSLTSALTPLHAIVAWLLLDALFLWGLRLWQRAA